MIQSLRYFVVESMLQQVLETKVQCVYLSCDDNRFCQKKMQPDGFQSSFVKSINLGQSKDNQFDQRVVFRSLKNFNTT